MSLLFYSVSLIGLLYADNLDRRWTDGLKMRDMTRVQTRRDTVIRLARQHVFVLLLGRQRDELDPELLDRTDCLDKVVRFDWLLNVGVGM